MGMTVNQQNNSRNEQDGVIHSSNNDSSGSNNSRVGNHTQSTYSTLVTCPLCNEETRMDTPSVKLAVCENNECEITAWIVSE